jgi:hypothetical protein
MPLRTVLLALTFSVTGLAHANYLVVTVTGTVTTDFDTSNIFGFGVSSPIPPGPGLSLPSTAAGQPVSMTFVLDLNNAPPDACAGGVCSQPGHRSDYFTNLVPNTHWITTSDTIGGQAVPEFAPHGGNVNGSDGIVPALSGSYAFAQLWTENNGKPYNEFDAQSTQSLQTTGHVAPGVETYSESSETSFLRIDSIGPAFLSGLSLNQSFAWRSAFDDGLSVAMISRELDVGTCVGGRCSVNEVVDAEATVQIDSVTGEIVESVPEPASFGLIGFGLAGIGAMLRIRRAMWPLNKPSG